MKLVAFGKWILAGEHAVLRGCPALVFPLRSAQMILEYEVGDQPLHVEFAGERGDELRLLVWSVLESAVVRLGRGMNGLVGTLRLHSSLPIGAGLGASGALCALVARWCVQMGWLSEDKAYDFARGLEDLFHGESSGVDVAVALSGQGMLFQRQGERRVILPKWEPQIYLSYSGQRGVTAECVNQVKLLIQNNPRQGLDIDDRMLESVRNAERALTAESAEMGFAHLQEAIQSANSCFKDWGLTTGALSDHLVWLESKGAQAVKPTGSGGGGYALSLWSKPPPDDIRQQLLSAF